jgi:hypothetical protein
LDDFIFEQCRPAADTLPFDFVDQLIEGCLNIAKLRYV